MTKLIALLENILDEKFSSIESVDNFHDLEGWDSLQYVRLVIELQNAYSIDLTEDDISCILSVAGISRVLTSKGCQL